MPLEDSAVPEVRTLMSGLRFGESPRWRDGRFWSRTGLRSVGWIGGRCVPPLHSNQAALASISVRFWLRKADIR